MRISPEVASFLLGHVLIVLGTRGDDLSPEFGRGFGVRMDPGGEAVEIVVSRRQWPMTIANIEANGALAMTASEPETYRTYQLKGLASSRPANEADGLLAEAYAQKLSDHLKALGVAWAFIGYYFVLDDLVVVRLQVTEIYIQTPGPKAGQPIGDGA